MKSQTDKPITTRERANGPIALLLSMTPGREETIIMIWPRMAMATETQIVL